MNSKILYSGLSGLNRTLASEEWGNAKYVILLDENTFQHCLPRLISLVEPLQEAEFIEVHIGEEAKSLEVATQVWQTLLDEDADRNTVLVNLGGGSICDLGGYLAAGYKRGIRYINVPTTLLAMTDAAIGGKTAIDFGGVKNSLGHFYPPTLVAIDTAFLATLPEAEILNGEMEMVKTAAVTDPMLYKKIITEHSTLNTDTKAVARIKARVVKADPLDHSIRKILNFGHTFGHAIEVFSSLPHGLSVGIGMKAAMYLSMKKLCLEEPIYNDYSKWLADKVKMPHYNLRDIEAMLHLLHNDKKNADGEIRCVLLQELGAPAIDVTVSDNEVRDTLLKL